MHKPDAIHAAMESTISFSCNPEECSIGMEGEIRVILTYSGRISWAYAKNNRPLLLM